MNVYDSFRNELENYYHIFYSTSDISDCYIVQRLSGGYVIVARYYDIRDACYASLTLDHVENCVFDEGVLVIERSKIVGSLDINIPGKGQEIVDVIQSRDDDFIYMN